VPGPAILQGYQSPTLSKVPAKTLFSVLVCAVSLVHILCMYASGGNTHSAY